MERKKMKIFDFLKSKFHRATKIPKLPKLAPGGVFQPPEEEAPKQKAQPKEITMEDCEALYAKFNAYAEKSEQHEWPLLALIKLPLDIQMEALREAGGVEQKEPKELRAMFRVVLKAIHEDYSDYLEPEGQ